MFILLYSENIYLATISPERCVSSQNLALLLVDPRFRQVKLNTGKSIKSRRNDSFSRETLSHKSNSNYTLTNLHTPVHACAVSQRLVYNQLNQDLQQTLNRHFPKHETRALQMALSSAPFETIENGDRQRYDLFLRLLRVLRFFFYQEKWKYEVNMKKMDMLLCLLILKVKQWQTTPQLEWHRELRRRQLLKAFLLYTLLKMKEEKRKEKKERKRRFLARRKIFIEARRR